MSITSDLNLMDLLFDKEDPSLSLSGLEKDDLGFKNNFDVDLKSTFDLTSDMWTSNPDEFLNSILSMDDPSFEMLQPLPETTDDEVCTSGASDSGILSDRPTHDDDSAGSVDLHMSPSSQDYDDDVEVIEHIEEEAAEIITLDDNIELDQVKQEAIDPMSQGEVQLQNNTAIISMNLPSIKTEIKSEPVSTPQKLTLRTVQSRRLGRAEGMQQVIRVTPLVASGGSGGSGGVAHPRSILLPVNLQDVKDIRTIKIINASNTAVKRARCRAVPVVPAVPAVGKATPVALVQVRPPVNQANSCYSSSSSNSSTLGSPRAHSVLSGDESGDESSDSQTHPGHFQYPRLVLSAEEKRLMQKEGVTLPTHYPLTKQEERELKRIRRKIRNKISAQDSRKRKKEYVDGLEDRVKQCTDENRELLKRLKVLQSQNESLTGQLHRLRSLLSRNSSKAVQPATCMMVLLLSLALVMVPTLRPNATTLEEQELSAATAALSQTSDSAKLSALPGRSRTLLYSQLFGGDLSDDLDVEMEDLHTASLHTALPPLGKRRADSLLQDHDYSPPMSKKSRTEYLMSKFVDFPVDDVWPPPKKDPVNTIGDRIDTVVELLSSNNKSDLGDSFIADDSPAAITLPYTHEGF